MNEWKFKRDTSFRKQFFVPDSFAHPAKMDAQLLIKIVEEYTRPGEVILDPMAGSGTTMLACTLGRHCVLVELEDKFCKMMQDNWEQVRMRPQLGSRMGGCQIIQGDARLLSGLLVDKIVTSPPFGEAHNAKGLGVGDGDRSDLRDYSYLKSGTKGQIGDLPYGEIDKCIFSPPYAEAQSGGGIAKRGYQGPKHGPTDLVGKRSYMPENIGDSEGQIGNFPYGLIDKIVTSPPYSDEPTISESYLKIRREIGRDTSKPSQWYRKYDSIITSPPYEQQIHKGSAQPSPNGNVVVGDDYVKSASNIGNLKSDSYLAAMLQVYQQCHKILKPKGLMILVTKNFIRKKQIVRLDTDTIYLCEQAGFLYLERHYRELPGQSFWRRIYHQKHPEVEQINYEDILVFKKLT